jgi:hypothetical protein
MVDLSKCNPGEKMEGKGGLLLNSGFMLLIRLIITNILMLIIPHFQDVFSQPFFESLSIASCNTNGKTTEHFQQFLLWHVLYNGILRMYSFAPFCIMD